MLLESHLLVDTYTGVHDLECNGIQTSGDAFPNGMAGNFSFADNSAFVILNEGDAVTGGGRRAEMSFKPAGGMSPTGEMWYSWDFMVPSSWGDDPTGFAIMQIHESPGVSVAVQFTLHLEAGHLVARVPVDVLTPGNSSYRTGCHPFEFDRWYSMCFHASWQLTGGGFWELFANRVPMLKRFGFANAYDRAEGGYLKLGIYNYNDAEGWGSKSIHIRNVTIWSGNDGYEAAMGGVPLTLPRLLKA